MRFILLLVISILISSCNNGVEYIEIPSSNKRFVAIEAYLTDQRKIELSAINNILLTDELIIKPVWYADVKITNGKEYVLKNSAYTRSSDQRFINYVSDEVVSFKDKKVRFEFNYKDSLFISSETSVLSPVKLDSIQLVDHQNVKFYFDKNKDSDYYKTLVYLYIRDSVEISSRIHHIEKEGVISINDNLINLSEADSTCYILSKITKEHYLYDQSVNNAYLANLEPTVKADTLFSNIINGKGIFTYIANDTISINYPVVYIKEGEVLKQED